MTASAFDRCDDNKNTDQSRQLKSLNAITLTDQSSCSQKNTPTSEIRKEIEAKLKKTSDWVFVNSVANDRKKKFETFPWAEQFYVGTDSKGLPVPILDWFNNPKFSKGDSNKEQLKKEFVDTYVAYAEKYNCTPIIIGEGAGAPERSVAGIQKMGQMLEAPFFEKVYNKGYADNEFIRARNKQDEQMKLKDPELAQKVNDFVKKTNSDSFQDFKKSGLLRLCTNTPHLSTNEIVGQEVEPCVGDFMQNFKDNQFQLSGNELSGIVASAQGKELASCIKGRIAQGSKVRQISISSSASTLNNTKDAAKLFGAKGFDRLSQARAETTRDYILPALFAEADVPFDQYKKGKQVSLNSKGMNGDGTSGPCAYEVNSSGKEQLKASYKNDSGRKELEQYKYIKVTVSFDRLVKSKSDRKTYYAPAFQCKRLRLECPQSGRSSF